MLAKLKKKRPDALVTCDDMTAFKAEEKLDYIFITSGSVSLFTEDEPLRKMLRSIRDALCRGGAVRVRRRHDRLRRTRRR